MKKLFKYFGVILSAVLVTACFNEQIDESAEVGLGIKTFFPSKVVAGLEMTINGSGYTDLTEIVFPEDVSVTNFKVVTDNMVRVTVPKNVAAGKIKVRTATDEAESKLELTVGNTEITGYSKQEGEEINGGEQLTIYGTDLEFISAVELFLAEDDSPLALIKDSDFYRKGTSTAAITLPKKLTEKDAVIKGKVYTYDGKTGLLPIPAITFKPASDGGHWEIVKEVIWTNEVGTAVSWSGTYRFALEGHDGNNECIAEFPQDIWDRLKSETFYLTVEATDPQIRVTTGWWSGSWCDKDFQPGNDERLVDNGDGTWTLEINLTDPAYVDLLDEQHLLFTGDRFTPIEIYFEKEEWVGGGHMEIVDVPFWTNEVGTAVSWSGTYRFALEGHDGNNECIAEFPQDLWDRIKTETFYLKVEATDPQIRVTTGWWSGSWCDKDFQPGNDERLVDNGDGTWTLEINLTDPAYVDLLDEQHLLFTGDRFTPIEIYFEKEEWVGGGHMEIVDVPFWTNEVGTAVSWSGTYRFALEGHDGNNECIAEFPQDLWDRIKTETFYLKVEATDPQIRVTTGWWSGSWCDKDFQPGNDERLVDNGDGTWTLEINLTDPAYVDLLDEQHLLFTGDRFTPIKIYFME